MSEPRHYVYPGLGRIVKVEGRRKMAILLWEFEVSRTPTQINNWLDRFIELLEEEFRDPDFRNDLRHKQLQGESMESILGWIPERILGKKWEENN